MVNQSPSYNLKVVLKETGLKADVLRAWERRYDLPKPQRTPGGHRLYSEYDIETIKWLRARQAEGLSISRAVELWKESLEAGRDPLLEYSQAAPPAAERRPAAENRIEVLRSQWLEACMTFDSPWADGILNQAFAVYPVETVCTQILQQGIRAIGQSWHLNQASAQQEHFASALASRRLEALITATLPPTRQRTVLLGCPPGEQHTLSTQLLNLFLRRRGLKVVYLGADIPAERLEETADAIRPDLTVLAAQQLVTAAALQAAAQVLQGLGIPAAYGGLIFNRIPRLRERIPAYFLGESLEEAVEQTERLVIAPAAFSGAARVDEAGQTLAGLYREKRPLIEADLIHKLQKAGARTEAVIEPVTYFGSGLAAALDLGDPAFLEPDLEWVRRLLIERWMPAEMLIPYLTAGEEAIREAIGSESRPVSDWIGAYIARIKSTEDEWPKTSS